MQPPKVAIFQAITVGVDVFSKLLLLELQQDLLVNVDVVLEDGEDCVPFIRRNDRLIVYLLNFRTIADSCADFLELKEINL